MVLRKLGAPNELPIFITPNCEECNSELEVNSEGKLTCSVCGLQNGERVFEKKRVQNIGCSEDQVGGTHVGKKSERLFTKPLFKRIQKEQIQRKDPHKKVIMIIAETVLNRFLSSLGVVIQPDLNKAILDRYEHIFDSHRGLRFKNPNYLIPVLAYLFYRSHDVRITKKNLIHKSEVTDSIYYNILGKLPKKDYLRRVTNLDFRDEILSYLSRFKDIFEFEKEFMDDCLYILNYHNDLLKSPGMNGSPRFIAAIIAYILGSQKIVDIPLKHFFSYFDDTSYFPIQKRVILLSKIFNVKRIKTLQLKNESTYANIQLLKKRILSTNALEHYKKEEKKYPYYNEEEIKEQQTTALKPHITILQNSVVFMKNSPKLITTYNEFKKRLSLAEDHNHKTENNKLFREGKIRQFVGVWLPMKAKEVISITLFILIINYEKNLIINSFIIIKKYNINYLTNLTGKDPPFLNSLKERKNILDVI